MTSGIVARVLAIADGGARLAVIAATASMVVVVSAQVVMRYVFNGSFDWADELSRLAFVWAIFLAIPLGIRDGTHVGIELVVTRLPDGARRLLAQGTDLLAAALMIVVLWCAIVVAAATWSERLGSIDVTSSVFFFPVILGAAHSALHLLYRALSPVAPIGPPA